MPFGSNTFLFMGSTVGGVIQNILMPLGGQEENVLDKKSPQIKRDFINERSPRWSTVAKQCRQD